MKLFNTLLRKIKYNLRYLFGAKISIPSEFKLFERRKTNYEKFINTHCKPSPEDEVNLNDSLKIFGKVSNGYKLSKDIFSNYDFSNKKLKPAFFNVADVKVPYEASRFQYLQKANGGTIDINNLPLIYWNSPMDVAIRNINLIFHLLAIEDGSADAVIFGNNRDLLTTFISQHYEYISNNLENEGDVVGNHYLIELTSLLLTIATFSFNEHEEEFKFYHDELEVELSKQFYKDGTNFEGSTHYSAFVTEAMILCKLAIEEIDKDSNLLPRIEEIIKSNRLILSVLMNKGELSQIGDNDSGRLFYFYHDEDNPLKIDWLIKLIDHFYNFENKNNNNDFNFKMDDIDLEKFSRVDHPVIKIFKNNFNLYTFPDFGIYIWRNDEGSEYFSIRCGQLGQNGVGGHSHYDQLAIECFTDGKWIARDPGTGTYTDDIETRNNFRSLEFHWGPNTNIKFPKESEFDCFRLNHIEGGKLLFLDKNNFIGNAIFNGNKIYRKITIENGNIQISDFSNDTNLKAYESWGELNGGIKYKFSRGYKRIN